MSLRTQERHILAADIGGTNSRFAYFRKNGAAELELVTHVWLKTADADSFTGLLHNLRQSEFPFDYEKADIVGIAVAGPILGGVCVKAPLIPWAIDISRAKRDYGFRRAILMNDFVAQAFSCLSPIGKGAETVLPGAAEPQATIAVIGAGTGLGKAIIVADGRGGFRVAPSEGAHACFPFVGKQEFALQRLLMKAHKTGYATYNHVVSGSGLTAIHEFLTGNRLEPAEVAAAFPSHPQTLAWFARFYGRACRDFALETLSRGGVYIAGGLAAKNPEIVQHECFKKEFLDSAALSAVLAVLPVFLIRNQNSGLWGTAMKAAGELAG